MNPLIDFLSPFISIPGATILIFIIVWLFVKSCKIIREKLLALQADAKAKINELTRSVDSLKKTCQRLDKTVKEFKALQPETNSGLRYISIMKEAKTRVGKGQIEPDGNTENPAEAASQDEDCNDDVSCNPKKKEKVITIPIFEA